MPRWFRVYGGTLLGAFVGALIGALLMLLWIVFMRGPMGWDDFPTGGPLNVFVWVFIASTAAGVARFGWLVATYEERMAKPKGFVGTTTTGTWSGAGWTLGIARDSVTVSTGGVTRRLSGAQLTDVMLRRQGSSWILELPTGVQELAGLGTDQAREVQSALAHVERPID